MKSIGVILLVLGIGSFALHAADMEFRLLMWVDNWGVETGNLIRYGMIGAGFVLALLGFFLERNSASQDA